MKRITRTICLAALVIFALPQTALGLAKPDLAPHPDTAPTESVQPAGQYSAAGGSAGGSNAISFASLKDGDIVVVLDPTNVTGHAGMLDRSRYTSISSYAMLSANMTPRWGVQYERCSKYRLYEWAYALRVPKEYSHRVAVRNYAAKQVGKPYSLGASKTDLRSFYCSKLAWVAYRNVTGVDLDGDGGFWVWPADLIASGYTMLIGFWS